MITATEYYRIIEKEQKTTKDREQIKEYKEKRLEESRKATKEYFNKLHSSDEAATVKSPNITLEHFKSKYKEIYQKEYIQEGDAIEKLIAYFNRDESFLDYPMREIDLNGVVKKSIPSLEKGLLIIGHYGNGKTSTMKTLRELCQYTDKAFSYRTASDVVQDYEEAQNSFEKKLFWKKQKASRVYFDDVKSEAEASNFGKKEIFREILEKRYNSGLMTFLTSNYKAAKAGDMASALLEFSEKYGGRLFDRMFEMFNIIEFEGKSKRM